MRRRRRRHRTWWPGSQAGRHELRRLMDLMMWLRRSTSAWGHSTVQGCQSRTPRDGLYRHPQPRLRWLSDERTLMKDRLRTLLPFITVLSLIVALTLYSLQCPLPSTVPWSCLCIVTKTNALPLNTTTTTRTTTRTRCDRPLFVVVVVTPDGNHFNMQLWTKAKARRWWSMIPSPLTPHIPLLGRLRYSNLLFDIQRSTWKKKKMFDTFLLPSSFYFLFFFFNWALCRFEEWNGNGFWSTPCCSCALNSEAFTNQTEEMRRHKKCCSQRPVDDCLLSRFYSPFSNLKQPENIIRIESSRVEQMPDSRRFNLSSY